MIPPLPSRVRILEIAEALPELKEGEQYDSSDNAIAEILRAYFTLRLISRKHINLTACSTEELEALQTLGVFDD